MSAGAPVLIPNRGVMTEVAGDAAHLVDPTNVTLIADSITRLLDNEEYRQEFDEQGKQHSDHSD